MTSEEIIEGNKLIAEFMGWKVNDNGHGRLFFGNRDMFDEESFDCTKEELDKLFNDGNLNAWFMHEDSVEFHSSWDWLMPVVEKIEDINGVENLSYGHSVIINNWDCLIKDCLSGEIRCDINPLNKIITSKIDSVWYAVIEFIRWYNTQKK